MMILVIMVSDQVRSLWGLKDFVLGKFVGLFVMMFYVEKLDFGDFVRIKREFTMVEIHLLSF